MAGAAAPGRPALRQAAAPAPTPAAPSPGCHPENQSWAQHRVPHVPRPPLAQPPAPVKAQSGKPCWTAKS